MDGMAEPAVRLLERHASGELDRDDVLDELAAGDPRISLVRRLMAVGGSIADGQEAEPSEARDALEHAQRMTDDARRLAESVRREFEGVSAELTGLRARLDDLAAALGACPGCWGEDPGCGWCRGRGRPGRLDPDPDAFGRLVMPAVRVEIAIRRRDGRDRGTGTDERRSA
jgi:hypothetical protein